MKRVADHLDARIARLDTDSTARIAAFQAGTANGRSTAGLLRRTGGKLALVLGIAAHERPIAALLHILGARCVHIRARHEFAVIVGIAPHKRAVVTFLDVVRATSGAGGARLGRLQIETLADIFGGQRRTAVSEHPIAVATAGASRSTALHIRRLLFIATLDLQFHRLVAALEDRTSRAFAPEVREVRGFRDAGAANCVARPTRIKAGRNRALPKFPTDGVRLGEPTFRGYGSQQSGHKQSNNEGVHGEKESARLDLFMR